MRAESGVTCSAVQCSAVNGQNKLCGQRHTSCIKEVICDILDEKVAKEPFGNKLDEKWLHGCMQADCSAQSKLTEFVFDILTTEPVEN